MKDEKEKDAIVAEEKKDHDCGCSGNKKLKDSDLTEGELKDYIVAAVSGLQRQPSILQVPSHVVETTTEDAILAELRAINANMLIGTLIAFIGVVALLSILNELR